MHSFNLLRRVIRPRPQVCSAPRAKNLMQVLGLSMVTLMPIACSAGQHARPTPSSSQDIRFKRASEHPYVPRVPGTFFSVLIANPDVVDFMGDTLFFFRGQDESGKDQIGLWKTPADAADGVQWDEQIDQPVIPVSEDRDAPDSSYILDPAAIASGDTLRVYYTGKSHGASTFSSICLATTVDGQTFEKYAGNPILEDAIAPEVVFHEGRFYLFYQRLHEGRYWEVYVATSRDGIDFEVEEEVKVFGPSRRDGDFDAHSVATARIFKEDEWFYMTYAGCREFLDYPESIGLARSKDLLSWERYGRNPVFERGGPGTWDEGALWFGTVRKIGGRYVMWYEGTGSGLGLVSARAREASVLSRGQDYGGYRVTSFSQMGLAEFEGSLADLWH